MLRGGLFPLLPVLVFTTFYSAGSTSQDRFLRDVFPILKRAGCDGCHNPHGVASASRLQFPPADASPEQIETFATTLRALIDTADPESSLLLRKPTMRLPHTGGRRILPDSADEEALRAWIRSIALLPEPTTPNEKQTKFEKRIALRRLTHSQYDNSVRDLLGDTTGPGRSFPSEDFVEGFKNQIQAQSISPILAEAYNDSAEHLAARVVIALRSGENRGILPCSLPVQDDASCLDRFIRHFGFMAFRRPLDETEIQRYSRLFEHQEDFMSGVRIVVEAMLQSPNFLFLLDSASTPQWAPFARASRLSYFLWDSMPDDALMRSASVGELDTAADLERTARRMLASPKAREAVREFISQWLRLDRVLNMLKERRAFPQFTRELALAMSEETLRFVESLIWENRNFMELFTADHTFVNADLAALYELSSSHAQFARVPYPPGSDRAGILAHGSFLAMNSKPSETSPTARGLFIREHFLCQRVPQPPPGVNTNLPPATAARPQTNRDRLTAHLSNETCAGCHNLIDPIGFGLERFDAIGARQEKFKLRIQPDNDDQSQPRILELALDARGWIAGVESSDFASPRELGRILATNRQCQECIVKQLFRYAMGRTETPEDQQILRRIFEDFRASGFRFTELMISLIKWTEFTPASD